MHEPRGGFALPSVGEQVAYQPHFSVVQAHAHRGEPLTPPDLRARVGVTLDRGQDAGFVEHHVQMRLVPQGREDLACDPERGSPVMVLLDRLGKRERELAGLAGSDHGDVGR
jgi:hypothetical protein